MVTGTKDFLLLLNKVEKALNESGVTIVDSAASLDGLMCHVSFKDKLYGLFLVQTDLLYSALEHIKIVETENQGESPSN